MRIERSRYPHIALLAVAALLALAPFLCAHDEAERAVPPAASAAR